MQNWMTSLTQAERLDYLAQSAIVGAAFGGIAGIAAAISPAALGYTNAVIGGIGLGSSIVDMMQNEVNLCNVLGAGLAIGGGLSGGQSFTLRIPKFNILIAPPLYAPGVGTIGGGGLSIATTGYVTISISSTGALLINNIVMMAASSGGGGGGGGQDPADFDEDPEVQQNRTLGKIGEEFVRENLRGQGDEIIGEQVGMRYFDESGARRIRYIDFLIERAGELFGVEVKTGDFANYSTDQQNADAILRSQGGWISRRATSLDPLLGQGYRGTQQVLDGTILAEVDYSGNITYTITR
jgi:hypothetical protein